MKPLRRRAREAEDTEEGAGPRAPVGAKARPAKTAPSLQRPAKPVTPPPPPLAAIARREKQKLARGRVEIDARIDLHGMTQSQAHAALARFLRRAQGNGAKFTLVITGKGVRAVDGTSERGVLRRQVPLWLQLPELRDVVVGFEEAHVAHGGEGALYVRLRRARGEK